MQIPLVASLFPQTARVARKDERRGEKRKQVWERNQVVYVKGAVSVYESPQPHCKVYKYYPCQEIPVGFSEVA